MTDYVVVFPREAFLLGYACGTYGPSRFRAAFEDLIIPFFPSFEPDRRKSLSDLVRAELKESADWKDPKNCPPGGSINWKSDPLPDAIHQTLREWADQHGHRDLFELGEDLCEFCTYVRFLMEDIDVAWEFEDFRSTATRVAESPWVRQSYFLNESVQHARKVMERAHAQGVFPESPTHPSMYSPVLTSLHFGVGELLGVLRDADEEARMTDAASEIPRSLSSLTSNSDPETIRQTVMVAQRLLSDSTEVGPAMAINATSPSIEALAKRAWGADRVKTSNSMATFFRSFLPRESGASENERRFASIAIPLHINYRNKFQHDFGESTVSIWEAKYFLSAVLALCELADQIRSEHRR